MSFTAFYRNDYVGETINSLVDGKTISYFVKPRDNVFMPSNVDSAIVLGNGLTRNYADNKFLLKINANKVPQAYKLVYACNRAVHEEENYDYYILRHNVFLANVKKERFPQIYLPNNIFLNNIERCNLIPMISHLDAGSSAVMLAAFDGHKKIFMMGFDGSLGNGWQTVYDDTFPYNQNNSEVSLAHWKDYMTMVLTAYSDTEFYRIRYDGQQAPDEWRALPNFKDVSMREAVLLGDF